MKKLVKLYRFLEWLLLVWVVTCTTLCVLNLADITEVNWLWVVSPMLFMALLPLFGWLVGFFTLLGRNLYGWFYQTKAERLAKQIKKDMDELEKKLK